MAYFHLISDMAPTTEYTAGIVLEQLMNQLDGSRVDLSILVDTHIVNYRVSRSSTIGNVSWFVKPNENWERVPAGVARLGEYFANAETNHIIKELMASISRNRPDHLIFVIQGQTTIRIAQELSKIGIPFTLIHWDPWTWWSREKRIPSHLSSQLEIAYSKISTSGYNLLPTPQFGQDLDLNESQMKVLFPAIDIVQTRNSTEKPLIQLVFIGQAYAINEIRSVIAALDQLGWKVDGRGIELHTFGQDPLPFLRPGIHFHGWINYLNIRDRIKEFDVALLPYPSPKDVPDVHRLSFPSKLVQYIASLVPILYVGPEQSSVASLVDQCGHSLGSSFSAAEFSAALVDLRINHLKIQSNMRRIHADKFSKAAQAEVVSQWLSDIGVTKDFDVSQRPPKGLRIRLYPHVRISIRYKSIHLAKLFQIRPNLILTKFRNISIRRIKSLIKLILK
jgi:hypothetical protein